MTSESTGGREPAPERPVGFVGLGHMGGALAARIASAGMALVVHDLDPAAVRRMVDLGCRAAIDAADVARQCDVVALSLPSPAASLAVCRAMRQSASLRLVIETSTVGPRAIRQLMDELRAGRAELLDAPVSGGPSGARAGTLSVMYSGSPTAVHAGSRFLEAIANRRFNVGDAPGLAQVCKLVNNAISAAGMIAACEATLVGVKAGLDARVMIDAINAGSGRNAATLDKFPRAILPGTFDFGGPLGLMLKDLSLFNEQAAELGVRNSIAPATLAAWEEAVRRMGPQADYCEVIRHMEADAGAQVRALPPH